MNWTELFYTSWWLLRSTSSDFSIRQEDEFADYEGREAWEKGGFLGQKSALNFLLSLADLCVIVLRGAEVVPWVAQAENTEKLSVFAVNQVLFWNDLASFVFCDFWRRDSVTMSFPGKDGQTLLADKEDTHTHTHTYIIYIYYIHNYKFTNLYISFFWRYLISIWHDWCRQIMPYFRWDLIRSKCVPSTYGGQRLDWKHGEKGHEILGKRKKSAFPPRRGILWYLGTLSFFPKQFACGV